MFSDFMIRRLQAACLSLGMTALGVTAASAGEPNCGDNICEPDCGSQRRVIVHFDPQPCSKAAGCLCRWWQAGAPPNSPIADSVAVVRVPAPVLSSQMVVQRQISQETLQMAPAQAQTITVTPPPQAPQQPTFTYRVNIVPPSAPQQPQAPQSPAAPEAPAAPEKSCACDPDTAARIDQLTTSLGEVSKALADLTVIVKQQNNRINELQK